ncbi:MAG: glycosyltransferase [Candidatus Woesearchaeota archaeon]|nr:glycosyltransferase [Candidatus Woesearchaeota archaeon]
MGISLCMIVKDEEDYLGRCLDSVKDFVDEIIIVDTGSIDKTKEIAKRYTKSVFDFTWNNNFSDARNFSLSKATKDWILVLDADEIISVKDMLRLKKELEEQDYEGYRLIQRNYSDDMANKKWVKITDDPKYDESKGYKGFVRNPILRVFKNKKDIFFSGPVHESAIETAKKNNLKLKTLELPIHHYYDEKKQNTLKERQLKYLQIAEENLKIKEDGRLYSKAAAVYFSFLKDYEKALEYSLKAADMGYNRENSLEVAAECHIRLKEYQKAYSIYKKLYESGYRSHSLCSNMAKLLLMHKKLEPALRMFKLALRQGHPDSEAIKGYISKISKQLNKE